jgi:hypothetical protein
MSSLGAASDRAAPHEERGVHKVLQNTSVKYGGQKMASR